ncbi:hypothetical protein CASFOL_016647 [Castilleja foliolosa]|uniref:Pectinesterase n=1 Tax=Castilleja foliolosa TaxID=1961234 RepID=A0ABD3DCY1_9LAMI
MASLSYYGAFIFFLASTVASYSLALSGYKINDPFCASAAEAFTNLTKLAIDQISNTSLDFAPNGPLEKLINNISPNDKQALLALGSCRELFAMAIDDLNKTLSSSSNQLTPDDEETIEKDDFYLCFIETNLETCIAEFDSSASQIQDLVSSRLNSSINAIQEVSENFERCYSPSPSPNASPDHHFVEEYYTTSSGRDPSWLSSEDKKLIESNNIKPNIVVAKDGSGNYRTISEAIKAVPSPNKYRIYIYVKKGVYFENVRIGRDQGYVYMFGDGMNKTIVSASRSVGGGGGYTILTSATFAVYGDKFIARDMGFYNTAGPTKDQAVALMAATYHSVFYKCRIDGYQDTLLVHVGLQFYRECFIYGTIDFIFGWAAVVIQSSTILAKKPLQGQGNAIAAHSRTNPKCKTDIVIQSSKIAAAEDLRGVSTALGRPWKPYSVVVYLENDMGGLISPVGWVQMGGPPSSTIFLAEYGNKGPGSNVAGRVRWNGVRTNLSYNEANQYTINSLIRGNKWLKGTDVPYNGGL